MNNFFIVEYENVMSFLIHVHKSVGSVLLLFCWKNGELNIVYCMRVIMYVCVLVLYISTFS